MVLNLVKRVIKSIKELSSVTSVSLNLTFNPARRKVECMFKKLRTLVVLTLAIALSMVMANAPSADAARLHTWERLAHCESTNRWHINTGNGEYGGLQFTYDTWRAYGGGKFASRADLATKREQIRIAQHVLHGQGWGAWPSCSSQLGLGASQKKHVPYWWFYPHWQNPNLDP
jgi:hypothetical protein